MGNVNSRKVNVLSYGINKFSVKASSAGIHAEFDAIQNLQPLSKNKKLKHIHIFVIRLSGNGKLQLSKPCAHCIHMLTTYPQKKGYIVKDIVYSNENGEFIKTNLNKIQKEEKHYSSGHKYNKKNKIIK